MIDDDVLFTKDRKTAAAGTIVTQYKDGGFVKKYYDKCPNCGGEADIGSDWPEPGDDTQGCCGYRENRGPDYNDACPEENGCGWMEIMEHYPNPTYDHSL